jgi:hypothetical protein
VTVATPYLPASIILDSNGIIYYSDLGSSQVLKWLPNSNGSQVVVDAGYPIGIKFDKNFNLYIAVVSANLVGKYLYEPSSCSNNG